MAEPFLAEIRVFSFGVTPKGWAGCNGQLLTIASNQALFTLLGTTFGGDGKVTFGLPDLRSRFPLGAGTGYTLGQQAGEAAHTLSPQETPTHYHTMQGSSSAASTGTPSNTWPAAAAAGAKPTYAGASDTTLGPGSSVGGANQPHQNLSPCLALNFCIATAGIYPSRP